MNLPESSLPKHLLSIALRQLGVRARFTSEIVARLKKETDDQSLIDSVILQIKPYLNDEELALHTAQKLLEKGKGPVYISSKLHSVGLSRTIIQSTIAQLPDSEIQAAINKLITKKGRLERQKLIRFLLSRGFSFHDIRLTSLA